MRVAACLLAFVTSTLAYRVTSPTDRDGWTNQGKQLLEWERVSTDKSTFSVVLDNQQMQGFTRKLLASNVDGTKLRTNLSPPSGGWPTGSNFRVNLVASPDAFDTIYAQSNDFVIKKVAAAAVDPSSSSASTGSEYDPTAEYVPAAAAELNPTTPGVVPTKNGLTGSGARPAVAAGAVNSGLTTPNAATDSTTSPVDPIIPNSAPSRLCFSSGLLGLSLLLFFALV